MWQGETIFLVGGGPSVAGQNIELLRGRKVIAVNSSFVTVPFADVLFFGDGRWWNLNRGAVLRDFKGEIVTVASESMGDKEAASRLCLLKKSLEWSDDPQTAFVRRTSVTGAINFGYHRGARKFVLLGIDGGPINGKTHHHDPHPWAQPVNWPVEQLKDFTAMADALKTRGVEIVNASPGSAVKLWPIVDLDQICRQQDKAWAS
jgi:hypothetical protein